MTRSLKREMLQAQEDLALELQVIMNVAIRTSGMTEEQVEDACGFKRGRIQELLGDDTNFSVRAFASVLYVTKQHAKVSKALRNVQVSPRVGCMCTLRESCHNCQVD